MTSSFWGRLFLFLGFEIEDLEQLSQEEPLRWSELNKQADVE